MTEIKQLAIQNLREVATMYTKDLDALPHDALAASPGGKARSPYDFTEEVVVVNDRFAQYLAGNDPGPWESTGGWMTCPLEHQDKEAIKARLTATVDAIANALDSTPDDQLLVEKDFGGWKMTPLKVAHFAALHTTYHNAQLCYVQALQGDDENHWR